MKNIYHRFVSEPWAISARDAAAWQSRFEYSAPARLSNGVTFFGDTIRELEIRNGVAIVPVDGVLIKGAGYLEVGFGARAHETIANELDAAVEANVSAIVLDISSPGGTVSGTPELAAKISAIAKQVPVYAFTDSQACSAAYWLASSARKVYATPSAFVGSIGAIMTTASFADALKSMGIDVTVFTSAGADLKAAGHPARRMSDAESAYVQKMTDQSGNMFLEAIYDNRPAVSETALNGAIFFGKEALKVGLVDGIAVSVNEVIDLAGGKLDRPTGSPGRRGARAGGDDEFPTPESRAAYERARAKGLVGISRGGARGIES